MSSDGLPQNICLSGSCGTKLGGHFPPTTQILMIHSIKTQVFRMGIIAIFAAGKRTCRQTRGFLVAMLRMDVTNLLPCLDIYAHQVIQMA